MMTNISRRSFLATAACAAAASRLGAQAPAATMVSLTAAPTGPHMPADFIGLSYEVQQLVNPSFFSAANAGLIGNFKALSEHGVLRLGGNTSEFAYWRPTPASPEPVHPVTRVVPGQPKPYFYPVTEEAVRNLAEFLQVTGWSCIYGIGMGTNEPQRAAAEAEFAAKTLGERLQYFQIGNEVDLYGGYLRDQQTWSPKTYLDEWLTLARAIADRVPGAKFGLPDIAARMFWLTQVAELWPSIPNPPRLAALSHHYYFGGPPTNPSVTVPNLLGPANAAKVGQNAAIIGAAARKLGVPVRMTEGNTCYGGGKPGLSDAFASALWAADYSMLLASNGYSGINLHGGSGPSVANSVGGALLGDTLLKNQNVTPQQAAQHPHPFYTPIASFDNVFAWEPVAYGLKFAGALSGGMFLAGDLTKQIQASDVDATAYAVKLDGGAVSVLILNKDADKDLSLVLDFGRRGVAQMEALTAPALDSREAHIAPAGQPEKLRAGKLAVSVPRASGLRVTVRA